VCLCLCEWRIPHTSLTLPQHVAQSTCTAVHVTHAVAPFAWLKFHPRGGKHTSAYLHSHGSGAAFLHADSIVRTAMDAALGADDAAASAAASASGLAVFAAGQAQVGPGLTPGMTEAATVASLNAWGAARDAELIQLRRVVAAHAGTLAELRGDLGMTQTVVASAFEQAKTQLQAIVDNFRVEAAKLRYDGEVAAAQSLSNLEQVVAAARSRFDAQDALVANGLTELAQRLGAVDAWAQAEPARVAALVEAAPTQQRWRRSPGGVTTPPPVPSTPQQAQQRDGSWDAYAAAQGPAPPDAWARPQATAPLNFNIASPPGIGGKGDFGKGGGGWGNDGGKGGSFPRDLRINPRDWGDTKKLDSTTSYDGFQIWKDRALTHLSKERPDVRTLLAWAETQTKPELDATLTEHAALGRRGPGGRGICRP
jgi:hypothetical protein